RRSGATTCVYFRHYILDSSLRMTHSSARMSHNEMGVHPSDLRAQCNSLEYLLDSVPAQSGITRPRSIWAWLGFVVGLGLTLPLIWHAWTIIGPNTYVGGDGKAWQSLIRAVRDFAPAFHVNILSPLQGVAGFGDPINIWADPTYWPFFSDDPL